MFLEKFNRGCSGGVSFFYNLVMRKKMKIEFCCDEHDLAYEEGGTEADRKFADLKLKECIELYGYSKILSNIFWIGVRIFGKSHFNYTK